jgi:hypothetical protein
MFHGQGRDTPFQTTEDMKTYERNPDFIDIQIYGINENKVQLSVHVIQCCVMNMWEEVAVYLHAFLTAVLFGGERMTTHLQSVLF